MPRVGFPELDPGAVSRALGRLAEPATQLVDAFFERRELFELPPEGEGFGLRHVREEGFALRLQGGGRCWMASRDGLDGRRFESATRQVSRRPATGERPLLPLRFGAWPEPPDLRPLLDLPERLERLLRQARVAFPFRLRAECHRRWVSVVADRLVPAAQSQQFYSLSFEHPGGRYGTLLPSLETADLETPVRILAEQFRARDAKSPTARATSPVVLAAAAAAVFLHEAVSHTLEADTLALTGEPPSAIGLRLGAPVVDLADDPGSAPEGVRRETDDEGAPVRRRWLLRGGVVEQPLADRTWAERCPELDPGAAWRGDRHLPPGPRSMHLDLQAGEQSRDQLLAGEGLFVPSVVRGRLDPLRGTVALDVPSGRRFQNGELGEPVGPFRLRGTVESLLMSVSGIGEERHRAGAGWCAKGGQRLPVWATVPAVRIEEAEIAEPSAVWERP